jgi:hypothetical protein
VRLLRFLNLWKAYYDYASNCPSSLRPRHARR